jgi:hypothetical protein
MIVLDVCVTIERIFYLVFVFLKNSYIRLNLFAQFYIRKVILVFCLCSFFYYKPTGLSILPVQV